MPDQYDNLYPSLYCLRNRLYEDVYTVLGMRMRMTEGLRDSATQAARFAQGRTTPGKIVTRARAGYSFHEYGLAFDSCFVGSDPYLETLNKKDPMHAAYCWTTFGRLASANGLMWGGNFHSITDKPHCEKSYGLSVSELLDLKQTLTLKEIHQYIETIERGI